MGYHDGNSRRLLRWIMVSVVCVAYWLCSSSSSSNLLVHGATSADAMLDVHIIAHSHCDPGWLNTFEKYYTTEVKLVLDSVFRELSNDPAKKFVWAETSFFQRWYEVQSVDDKKKFKHLVYNGQLEFIGGGWVQNDEANPDYPAIINQMTEGHQYLLKNFGVQPRIAWQIDPFGHSSVTPSLFAAMGFDALVLNRIHHQTKATFKRNKHMEFLWRGVDLGTNTDILTHVLHTHYSAPRGYDWEEGAQGINSGNVGYMADGLVQQLRDRATAYRTPTLLVAFGDDFKFKQAGLQFSNMGQLIDHINSKSSHYNMKVQYSTLSDYFRALHAHPLATFPVYQGDFFPYADNEDSYWTGYYTTRPMLKAASRRMEAGMRSAEIIHALLRSSPTHTLALPSPDQQTSDNGNTNAIDAAFWEDKFKDLQFARQEAALFMHHDIITGTAREEVVNDVMARVNNAHIRLSTVLTRLLEHAFVRPSAAILPSLTYDAYTLPVSSSTQTQSHSGSQRSVPIVLYNSLGWQRSEIVSVKVSSRYIIVFDSNNQPVPSQVDVVFDDFLSTSPQSSTWSVSWLANMPPLAATTYFIHLYAQKPSITGAAVLSNTRVYKAQSGTALRGTDTVMGVEYVSGQSSITLANDLLKLQFNPSTGLLDSVEDLTGKRSVQTKQRFARYMTDRSGAYLFRPNSAAQELSGGSRSLIRACSGPILNTLHTRTSEFDVTFKLAGGADVDIAGHVSMTMGVTADGNTEVVLGFRTDLDTKGNVYTHNGLGFMERHYEASRSISSNFYPSVTGAVMRDESYQLSINTGHSMACGCVGDHDIELMIHRHLRQDDGRGLAEPVNDVARHDIPIWLTFEPKPQSELSFRRRYLRLNHPVTVLFAAPNSKSMDANEWQQNFRATFEPLTAPLPDDIHILNLLARDSVSDDIAIRFQGLDSLGNDWRTHLRSLFTKEYQFAELRGQSLSLNHALLNGEPIQPRLVFRYSNRDEEKVWQSDIDNAADGQIANQNTNEEGVFLSKAALEKLAADQAAAAARNTRQLLGSGGKDDDEASLSLSLSLRESLIEVEPLQIRSYIFRVMPTIATTTTTVKPSTPISTPTQPSLPPSSSPSRVSLPVSVTALSRATSASSTATVTATKKPIQPPPPPPPPPRHNVDHQHGSARIDVIGGRHIIIRDGHRHEEPPSHGPAATVMPSRPEYLCVMGITIAAVIFIFLRLDVCGKGIAAFVDTSSSSTTRPRRGPLTITGGKRA